MLPFGRFRDSLQSPSNQNSGDKEESATCGKRTGQRAHRPASPEPSERVLAATVTADPQDSPAAEQGPPLPPRVQTSATPRKPGAPGVTSQAQSHLSLRLSTVRGEALNSGDSVAQDRGQPVCQQQPGPGTAPDLRSRTFPAVSQLLPRLWTSRVLGHTDLSSATLTGKYEPREPLIFTDHVSTEHPQHAGHGARTW